MLEIAVVILLSVHLLLVDIAMASPLLCVWLEWRDTRFDDRLAGRASATLARIAVGALAGGIALGFLLLAIRWWQDDRAYLSAFASVPASRIWFGLAELGFYFVCMGAYLALCNRWRHRRLFHRALAIAAASNLMIHFPALFAIISIVSTRAELMGHALDRADFQRLLVDGEVLSRVVHVWLASIAISVAVVMGLGLCSLKDPQQRAGAERLIQRGALIALVPILLQIPSGLWVALQIPESARDPLFGGDWFASGLFAAALALALVLMHRLAGIALGDHDAKQIRLSMAVMSLIVFLMVGTRCRVQKYLATTPDHGARSEESANPGRGLAANNR